MAFGRSGRCNPSHSVFLTDLYVGFAPVGCGGRESGVGSEEFVRGDAFVVGFVAFVIL